MTLAYSGPPLSPAETSRLAELEAVVRDGIDTFVTVGRALAEINDSRLYRQTHATFATYVRDEFGIGKSHAYRMISAARVAEAVSPIGDITTESQARELVGLTDDEARAVLDIAQAGAKLQGRDAPTAADLRECRRAWEKADQPSEQMTPEQARDLTEFINITSSFRDDVVDAEVVDETDPLAARIAAELAASDADYATAASAATPPAPKPAAQRRRPLTESFWQAAYDLTKVTERIARLADDDRFPQNAEQVATANRSDLIRAIDALQGVVNRLPSA